MRCKKSRFLLRTLALTLCLLVVLLFPLSAFAAETEDGFVYYLDLRTEMPNGFVNVLEYVPDAEVNLRYLSDDNFVGTNIDGYLNNIAISTKPAAQRLKIAADNLREQGYILIIWDAYRPRDAVKHFIRWSNDSQANSTKTLYYPNISKFDIIDQGYIAPGCCVHSRGSAFDVTLRNIETGEEVDMGTGFDFFDVASHSYNTRYITAEQAANRAILRNAMVAAGFEILTNEWWHFKLATSLEPYPETYFNFYVQNYFEEV